MIVKDKQMTTNGEYYHIYSDDNRYVVVNGTSYGHYWTKNGVECTEGDTIDPVSDDATPDEIADALEEIV